MSLTHSVPRRRGDQPSRIWSSFSSPARSPQARGSTGVAIYWVRETPPFPAGAGINRSLSRSHPPSPTVPRRRGDQPAPKSGPIIPPNRSPQARGSTDRVTIEVDIDLPFPAGAGINRTESIRQHDARPVPRRRGDKLHLDKKCFLGHPLSPCAGFNLIVLSHKSVSKTL